MSGLLAGYRNTITVTDGSWSTQLQARGMPMNVPAETANVTHPQLVAELAREYTAAGAKVLTTNTFAAHRYGFERRGGKHNLEEINRAGARLAKLAAQDAGGVQVAGSIGPSGKILAVQEAQEAALCEAYAAQAHALAEGGVDMIVLETFTELAEIILAVETVKKATGLPVVASMSFDSGPQRTRTMMGALAEDCATALTEAGADAIGCNCGAGIGTFLPVVVALRANTDLPIWVKPNAGMPELEEDRVVYRQTPDEFGHFVPDLFEAGANFMGGCCGAGPAHVKRIAALVASWQRKHK